jgi:acetyltransferase-like isoleucine patch superfamily enzyme
MSGYDIGDYTYGNPTVYPFRGRGGGTLTIGKFCQIADGAEILLGGEHHKERATGYPLEFLPMMDGIRMQHISDHATTKGNVVIGNDVWIGHRALILSGVTIADGAVIGASAVVTHNVEPYSIVAGSPAKFVGYRIPLECIAPMLVLRWWDWEIEQIGQAQYLLQSPLTVGVLSRLISFHYTIVNCPNCLMPLHCAFTDSTPNSIPCKIQRDIETALKAP